MPYRIDVRDASDPMLDRLVELGALDVEASPGGLAALLPDSVTPEEVASALGVDRVAVSPAVGRDAGSVWILSPRPIRIGSLRIVPAHLEPEPGALRLIDAPAFGTGLHPTTALCLEALDEAVQIGIPDSVLDVGTGSGVLALSALVLGVPRAMAIDIVDEAIRAAADNAALNGLAGRLELARGTPDTTAGTLAARPRQRSHGAAHRDGARALPVRRPPGHAGGLRNSRVPRTRSRPGLSERRHAIGRGEIARGLGRPGAARVMVTAAHWAADLTRRLR